MLTDNTNKTHYDTEDLNRIIQEWFSHLVTHGINNRAAFPEGVKYINKPGIPYAAQLGRTVLSLTRPSTVIKADPLLAMGTICADVPTAPTVLIEKILGAVMGRWGCYDAQRILASKGKSFAAVAAAFAQTQVLKIVKRPSEKRRRLTAAEKIERLEKHYGGGGELSGPAWAYASGKRYRTYKWADRVHDARKYYERELQARQYYGKQLQKLGVEPIPYQTFSEYLRMMADRYEGGDK